MALTVVKKYWKRSQIGRSTLTGRHQTPAGSGQQRSSLDYHWSQMPWRMLLLFGLTLLVEMLLCSHLESCLVCRTQPPRPTILARHGRHFSHGVRYAAVNSTLQELDEVHLSGTSHMTSIEVQMNKNLSSSTEKFPEFVPPWHHLLSGIVALLLTIMLKPSLGLEESSSWSQLTDRKLIWVHFLAPGVTAMIIVAGLIWSDVTGLQASGYAAVMVTKMCIICHTVLRVKENKGFLLVLTPLAMLAMANPISMYDECWLRDTSLLLWPYEQKQMEILLAMANFLIATGVALVMLTHQNQHDLTSADHRKGGPRWILLKEYPITNRDNHAGSFVTDDMELDIGEGSKPYAKISEEDSALHVDNGFMDEGKRVFYVACFTITLSSALDCVILNILQASPSQDNPHALNDEDQMDTSEWASAQLHKTSGYLALKSCMVVLAFLATRLKHPVPAFGRWILPPTFSTAAGFITVTESFWFLSHITTMPLEKPILSHFSTYILETASATASAATIGIMLTTMFLQKATLPHQAAALLAAQALGGVLVQSIEHFLATSYLDNASSNDNTQVFLANHFILGILGAFALLMPLPLAGLFYRVNRGSNRGDVGQLVIMDD